MPPVAEEHGEDSKRKDDDVWSSRPSYSLVAVERLWFRERLAFPALSVELRGASSSLTSLPLYHRCPYSCPGDRFRASPQTETWESSGPSTPPQRSWCRQCRVWLDARCLLQCAHRLINAFFDAFGDEAPWADEA
jgi:hypothetical protein